MTVEMVASSIRVTPAGSAIHFDALLADGRQVGWDVTWLEFPGPLAFDVPHDIAATLPPTERPRRRWRHIWQITTRQAEGYR